MTVRPPPLAPSPPRQPAPPPTPACLQGLTPAEATRPAGELFAAIPWDGPTPDPDTFAARDFLAIL